MNLSLAPEKKYLIAVSGGPDSMALFDMARKANVSLVVCHVNYKKRKTADRDEKIVADYCEKYNVPLYVKTVREAAPTNFQKWAREYRYEFFKEIYLKEKCDVLLIAHQADDFLETYFSKKKRRAGRKSIAIRVQTSFLGMNVYRPLLRVYKDDLIAYCIANNVAYGIDETNFEPLYLRNEIRRELSALSREEKEVLYRKIEDEQKATDADIQAALGCFSRLFKDDCLSVSGLLSLPDKLQKLTLLEFFDRCSSFSSELVSNGRIKDLIEKLKTNKNGCLSILSKREAVERSYDCLRLVPYVPPRDFSYVFPRFEITKTNDFVLTDCGPEKCGIYVRPADYPITIRSYLPGDEVAVNEGRKRVARLYIDAKIPVTERKRIPLLITASGRVILVSGLYRDILRKTLQSNVFVVKC